MMRVRATWRLPITFGWLAKQPLHPGVVEAWLRPARTNAEIRRDLRKILRGIDPRATVDAAARLRSFDRPTLLVWGAEDRVFPLRYAERLAADIPSATLETVADSYAFVPEDQPARCAALIGRFVRAKVRG
jgi:pimeloyl-ACP methyl ester carboxylesterase